MRVSGCKYLKMVSTAFFPMFQVVRGMQNSTGAKPRRDANLLELRVGTLDSVSPS